MIIHLESFLHIHTLIAQANRARTSRKAEEGLNASANKINA